MEQCIKKSDFILGKIKKDKNITICKSNNCIIPLLRHATKFDMLNEQNIS